MNRNSENPFYLVSASPRRGELLNRLGIEPLLSPVDLEEFHDPALSPEELTLSLANQKMTLFLDEKGPPGPGETALTADTIVHIDGRHLGKPRDRDEADEMLRLLSGREHLVSTGFVLITGGRRFGEYVSTKVKFRELTPWDREFYLNSGEWHDAAGAYKIQEKGEILIKWIKGSWSNVMGLPISRIYAILRDNNYWSD
ncbi:MAG: septum formation protein Maf [Spirochaetales bacterium]|nr:septum formation protein Maf [Spirochaetales bacterium]